MEKKVIFFDFFGVISNEVGTNWLYNNMPDKVYTAKKELFTNGDIGLWDEEKVFSEVGKLVNKSAQQVYDEWMNTFDLNIQTLNLISRLRKNNYKTCIISNAFGKFLHRILADNDLYKYFDDVIISCDIGMIKPNKDIFLYALNKLNVSPEESIFVDDVLLNAQSACDIGISGIQFINNQDFEQKLLRLGLKL